jgi:hypothetical protein
LIDLADVPLVVEHARCGSYRTMALGRTSCRSVSAICGERRAEGLAADVASDGVEQLDHVRRWLGGEQPRERRVNRRGGPGEHAFGAGHARAELVFVTATPSSRRTCRRARASPPTAAAACTAQAPPCHPREPADVRRCVECLCGDTHDGLRTCALIVVSWRAGLRISEALALSETDLDRTRRSVLVRCGKCGNDPRSAWTGARAPGVVAVLRCEARCRYHRHPIGRPLYVPAVIRASEAELAATVRVLCAQP